MSTKLKTEFLKYVDEETGAEQLYEVIPPAPTEFDRGGIFASPVTEEYTTEIRLGADGKLYAPKEKIEDPSQLVDLHSNQVITGDKTFDDKIMIVNSVISYDPNKKRIVFSFKSAEEISEEV